MSQNRLDVIVDADTSPFRCGIASAQESLNGFHSVLSRIKGRIAAAFVGVASIRTVTSAIGRMSRLRELSSITGASVNEVVGLRQAFTECGLGAESLVQITSALNHSLAGTNEEGRDTRELFEAMGLDRAALASMPLTDQLRQISAGLARLKSQADRVQALRTLFGRGGIRLAPLLETGKLDEAAGSVSRIGLYMRYSSDAMHEAGNRIARMRSNFEGFSSAVATAVVPALDSLMDRLSKIDQLRPGENLGGALAAVTDRVNAIVRTLQDTPMAGPLLKGVAMLAAGVWMAKKTLGFAAGAVSRAAAPIARAAAFLARTAAPLARAAAFLRTIAMGVGSATGWGIVVAAMTTLVGLFWRAAKATGENNAFNVMLKGHQESEAKLREEIDAVETLTDRDEALKHVEEELAAAREARKDTTLNEHRIALLDCHIGMCELLKAELKGLNEEALRAAEIERQGRADLARRHDYAVQNQADMEKYERAEKDLAGKRQFEQAMASAKTPTERRTIADERVKTLQYEASLIEMLIASVKQSGLGISPDAFKADLARLHDLKEEIASIGVDRAREDQQESARREKQASWMTKFREDLGLLKGVGSPAEIERRQKIDETAREIMEQGGEKDKTKAEALATKRVDAEAELQRKKRQDERSPEIQSDRLSRIGLYVGGGGRADGHQKQISAHTKRMVELQQRTHEVLKRLLEKAYPAPTAVWA